MNIIVFFFEEMQGSLYGVRNHSFFLDSLSYLFEFGIQHKNDSQAIFGNILILAVYLSFQLKVERVEWVFKR